MKDNILRGVLSSLLLAYFITLSGAQTCLNNPNVNQIGQETIDSGRQVIVPNARFNCNGRITNVAVSMREWFGKSYPLFQVWHPTSLNSSTYNKTGEVQLSAGDFIGIGQGKSYYHVSLSFNSDSQIEFQSGDVIGYYQPSNPQRRIWSVHTSGYTSYSNTVTSPSTSIDINNVDNTETEHQPLIKVTFDMRCDSLLIPANGEITSCSSGRVGVGYEGDTCNFTCDTGYKLTGSDTRTCQSDGSWSGIDGVCRRVQCHDLVNGTLQCPNGTTTGVLGDSCTFSCNTGYKLQGSNSGMCLANGSWSGGDPICVALNCSTSPPLNNSQLQSSCDIQYQSTCNTICVDGYTGVGGSYTCVVTDDDTNSVGWSGSTSCQRTQCPELLNPANGMINCSLRDDGVHFYKDTCSFTCNTGYELTGSDTRTCQSNGSWSGSDNVCRRVSCSSFHNPINGKVVCSTRKDGVVLYEDVCSFSCNTGYKLTASSERTCQSDGSWSGSSVSCIIMECPSSSLPMNSMLAESCSSTYQSMCGLQCQEGFSGTGDPSYVCDVLSNGSSVMWMAQREPWRCERVCTSLSSPTNGDISCNSTGVSRYEDQCSFSCDPGYQLTGSSSRQCLSNGSWSGSDVTCDILHCDNLTDGIENSVLANDCGSEFGSVCRVECNTGYRAVGNDTFTCVSMNGRVEWRNNVNGGTLQCDIVTCEDLETPSNGNISCSSNNQLLQYQDICTFQCNDGYGVQGSVVRQCEASGEWNGSRTQCDILHCPNFTTLVPNSRSCDTSYTSSCIVECEDGYNRLGDFPQYSCGFNGTDAIWIFTGSGVTCSPVPCVNLSDPKNGNVTCSSDTSVFQDTCTYYCNRGYQLEGNKQTRCRADGTWSSEPVTCAILKCNDPEVEIANSQSVGVCNVTYGSSCSLDCSSGFSVSGNGEHVCDDVNDEGTSVKWRTIGNSFNCIDSETTGDDAQLRSISTIVSGAIAALLFVIIIILVVLIAILYFRKKSQRKQKLSLNTETGINRYCNSGNEKSKISMPPAEPVYEEAYFSSSSHEDGSRSSVVERALSTMNTTHVYAAPYEEPITSSPPSFGNHVYEVSSVSPYNMAELIEAEERIYYTLCEDEEDIGPVYSEPSRDEKKVYEEFEGKRFSKLYHKEIVITGELGSGEFGVVTYGKWTPSPDREVEVAIKTLNSDASDKDRLRFIQEAAIMCQFDHQNVIKLYGVVTETPRMIVLEYMSRGDLRNLLLQIQAAEIHPMLPIVLLKFCQEIAAGMAYLSSKHFVHRDLAARNILVSEKATCKIADFGMSRDLIDENYYVTSGGKIPLKWTAPEALHYRKYSVYSDVWSYACVLYEIWSLGHKPFEAVATHKIIERIENGYRLPPPPGCPRTMYRTMIKCWNPDPRSRPQFGQIVNVLAGNIGYLLGWSLEDKQICGKEAMTLGAPLATADNLYYDLQLTYAQLQ